MPTVFGSVLYLLHYSYNQQIKEKNTVHYCSNTRYAALTQGTIDFKQKQNNTQRSVPSYMKRQHASNRLQKDLITRCPFRSKTNQHNRDGSTHLI